MQVPSWDIRPLTEEQPLRHDEVELTAEQRLRILDIKAHNEMVDQRRRADLAARTIRPKSKKGRR